MGFSNEYEKEYIRRDGTVFPVSVRFWSEPGISGGDPGIWGFVRDITERKNLYGKVESSLREKELLLKEIHHRVKNNLQIVISLLNLQLRYIDDKRIIDALKESQNRIRAMSLVHEKLYRSENISNIGLSEYVRFLAESLFRFYGVKPGTVSLEIDTGDIAVDINTAIPLGLIINELVSNSLKYAFPRGKEGKISILIQKEDDRIRLIIRDNGIGIPEDMDWKNPPSLGLRLVTSLTEQLNGTIELDRTGGTCFTLYLSPKVPRVE
jgi:two-component sensor histidine kinase